MGALHQTLLTFPGVGGGTEQLMPFATNYTKTK